MMIRCFFLMSLLACMLGCAPEPVAFRNTDLSGATFGRHLNLVDHHGQARTLADFKGRVVVVFFGYTACPDVCPGMLARLAEVMKTLAGDASRVQVLFVTVDPERDSAERLQDYVAWFNPTFLGLRGDAAQTRAASDEFRVVAVRKPVDGELGYVIDHSSGAYLIDPVGRLRLHVREAASIDDIAADIRLLLQGK